MTHLAFKISGFSGPYELATPPHPTPPPPPDPKNKINFIGAVSKICGFGVRIHWIRVDGRSIRVRFQKYPDSFRRGLQDF